MSNKRKRKSFVILFVVWGSVFALMLVVFFATHFTPFVIKPATYYLINVIVSFASFLATSFFGISIYFHNASIREQNDVIRSQTQAGNKRAEAFRNSQFIAANYTIVDFVDNMQIYAEYPRYVQKLKTSKSFLFYLVEKGIEKDEVVENIDDYMFLTLRLPIDFVEGKKTIGKLKILSFKFDKEDAIYRFTPASKSEPSNALILYNEIEHRNEAVINLITKKDSDFYQVDSINPFVKIKIYMEIESMLGVIVSGAIELYFTNPKKVEESGANKYKINSSQFELIGRPKLALDKVNEETM